MAPPSDIPKHWEVRPSPGKGRGVFATQDIARGDLIMLETPIITLHRPGPNKPFNPDAVQAAFDSLPSAEKIRFLSLSGSGRPGATTNLLQIFLTNALSGANNDISCICIDVSLLNHSCVPNSTWNFRADAGTGGAGKYIVTATSDIRKDEEICITYAGYCVHFSAFERAAILWQNWHFKCDCRACKPGTAFQKASDIRRILYHATTRIIERCDGQESNPLPNQQYALAATGWRQLFSLEDAVIATFGEADITFIWWLRAKLLEAENNFDENLVQAYEEVGKRLCARMWQAGRAGRRLEHLETWFDNVKCCAKEVSDWKRIMHRPSMRPVYRIEDGKGGDPWTRGQVSDSE
jgi:hypothetical protein